LSKNSAELRHFFTPKNIAIVGASRSPQKLGYVLLDNLQRARFQGPIYPVNPQAERILGLTCYPTVTAIEETPDLAIITVPVRAVTNVLEECG
jgi:acyl-CoA synthetase (NDP forming)